uniref:Uncharacterized protein n=1 Tax=Meloidogyne incognita TaxID=6306 RepID=A0A914MK01_MELIC
MTPKSARLDDSDQSYDQLNLRCCAATDGRPGMVFATRWPCLRCGRARFARGNRSEAACSAAAKTFRESFVRGVLIKKLGDKSVATSRPAASRACPYT